MALARSVQCLPTAAMIEAIVPDSRFASLRYVIAQPKDELVRRQLLARPFRGAVVVVAKHHTVGIDMAHLPIVEGATPDIA